MSIVFTISIVIGAILPSILPYWWVPLIPLPFLLMYIQNKSYSIALLSILVISILSEIFSIYMAWQIFLIYFIWTTIMLIVQEFLQPDSPLQGLLGALFMQIIWFLQFPVWNLNLIITTHGIQFLVNTITSSIVLYLMYRFHIYELFWKKKQL